MQNNKKTQSLVTITVGDQLFGIPILQIQDVLRPQKINKTPLASDDIVGSLNVRGRIITVIDMRVRLGMPVHDNLEDTMNVVIEHNGELYSLMVDKVGEVISPRQDQFESNLGTLNSNWREISSGIYRLEKILLVVLDVKSIFKKYESQAGTV